MKEIWRKIPGLTYYEASTFGRIRSMRTGQGVVNKPNHVMAGCPDAKGYLLVNCRIDGRSKTQRVHRLIAKTFIGEISIGHQINHLNGNKSDNKLANLEICSPSQNLKHRHEVLKIEIRWRGSKHGLSKLTEETVLEIRKRSTNGELATALAKEYAVTVTTIYCIVKRKTWTHI